MAGAKTDNLVYHILCPEEKLALGVNEDAIVTLVDELLYHAIMLQASDIHLQPQEHTFIVRYRIDGMLYNQCVLQQIQAPLVVSRLKVLANLDIAERRIPQDGRFRASASAYNVEEKRIIDFRVSTFPTLYGEKMVIRILDRSLSLLSLDGLGLSANVYEQLVALTKRPHGLFLVTGPTGCGKTTMLYALIAAMNVEAKNIVTIEDPIEYELTGITQSQINPKAGFTFENGLRAILRQDPDIIMIGEIRDRVTAHIAIEAALTGHLVLSTLHTNDAPSAVARLLEMDIEPFLISATLVGVLAQRLVRRLCAACKQTQEKMYSSSKVDREYRIYIPKGCKSCNRTGYKGRIGLFELLMINDIFAEHIMKKASAATLRSTACAHGMKILSQDGLEKMHQGITSLDEVLLVQGEEAY